ncbi:MAG: fimbrillin family protein [Bacteroidales bacterium]|nr:fimbrillin family protein [Bacteroidales bacterium]
MKKILLISAAMIVCLASCTKEQAVKTISSNEIQFNISLAGHSSQVSKASATAFEADDAVSLYAVEYNGDTQMPLQIGGNYINNEKLTYSGSAWSSVSKLYWSANACDFYAFYPYQASIGSVEDYPFSVSVDQSGEGYEASDLMFAKAEKVAKEAGSVSLQFNHMMSKCRVAIVKGPKFEGDIPNDIVAHIYNTTTDCKVDWTKGSVEKDAFGAKKTITMKKLSNEEFEAVLVPQNIEKRTPLIELTMGGIAYLLETSLSFRPGYCHTLTVTLNTSPDQEMIEINIDPNIQNWN